MSDYNESWEVYFTHMDDKPASISLDMNFENHPDYNQYKVCLTMRIFMNSPDENGYPQKEEFEILNDIEDVFYDNLQTNLNAFYVGRVTNNGSKDLFFYLKSEKNINEQLTQLFDMYKDYSFSTNIEEDKEHDLYFDCLYPTSIEQQKIHNSKVIKILEENGNNEEIERPIDHNLHFKTEQGRSAFFAKLTEIEWEFETLTQNFNKKDKYPYSTEISLIGATDYHSIDEMVSVLWIVAEQNNGIYDGWGTKIMK